MVSDNVRRSIVNADADRALEQWAIAALVGPAPPFSSGVTRDQWLRFLELHGIVGLMHARLRSADPALFPEPSWIERLALAARLQAARELMLRQEIGDVLAAARAGGLRPLVLKGAALAYLVYDEPGLRGRVDTDLLVPPDDKRAMMSVLEGLGYRGELIAAEHWATSERPFSKTVADVPIRLDLHWRINNSPLLWHEELEYAQLSRESQPVPALHADARCPSLAALLAHACLHLAKHSRSPMYWGGAAVFVKHRLNWLYDIHLLALAMNAEAWSRFVALIRAAGLVSVSRSAIEATASRFSTSVPPFVIETLEASGGEAADELLSGGPLATKWHELRALPSNHARIGWLREHLLPARAYMRARYPHSPRSPLAWLYLRRLLLFRRGTSAF